MHEVSGNWDHEGELRRDWKSEGKVFDSGGMSLLFFAEKDDRLYAVSYFKEATAKHAKGLFWSHKMFSTLFPHSFPRIYASFGNQDEEPVDTESGGWPKILTGTVRERIYTTTEEDPKPRHPFSRVAQFCQINGESLRFIFDTTNYRNFLIGQDGGEYYVDEILDPKRISQWLTRDSILRWMDSEPVADKKTGEGGKYTEEEKRMATRCLRRLQELYTKP